MSKGIFEMSGRPLRSRREAILLLLYTIRMFDIEEWIAENKIVTVGPGAMGCGMGRSRGNGE